ncbi:MAG: CHAT domain-containing protein [Planctomycetes bacterium]|nr:CHAT domain-containing protein [Planctomycetota bacterium]
MRAIEAEANGGAAGPKPAELQRVHELTCLWWSDPTTRAALDPVAPGALKSLYALLPRHSDADLATIGGHALWLARTLKDSGRLADARSVLEPALPALAGPRLVGVSLLIEAAEVDRLVDRWTSALERLDRAETFARGALQPEPSEEDRRGLRFAIEFGRASTLLEMGLGDRAQAPIAELERLARESELPLRRADAVWMSVRATNAAQRFDASIQRIEAFLRSSDGVELTALETGPGAARIASLLVRGSIAAVELEAHGKPVAEPAHAWLDAVLERPELAAGERALALVVRARRSLDRGEFERARADLGLAGDSVVARAGVAGDERLLSIRTLSLRLALEAREGREATLRAAEALEGELAGWMARWREQQVRRGGLGALQFRERREAVSELLRARVALGGPLQGARRALELVLDVQALGSVARSLSASQFDADTVLRELASAEGRGFLVFFAARDRTHVLALDASGISHHAFEIAGERLDELRGELVAAIAEERLAPAATPSAAFEEARAALSRELFPAELVERTRAWSTLVVVGLDSLGYVPFELLDGRDGCWIGESSRLAYLPSLPVGVALARRGASPLGTAPPRAVATVCVAPEGVRPEFTRDLEPLTFANDEERALRASLAESELSLYLQDEATWSAWSGAVARGADYGLILAHGVRDETREEPECIVLAGGEPVGPAEFEARVGALPNLLVLASCSAGRGRLRRGDDGRNQLVGAALAGGARTVVAPQVAVDYRYSLELVAALHEALLREGATPLEALRTARSRAPRTARALAYEPYLWHLTGLGDVPIARRGANPAHAPVPKPTSGPAAWVAVVGTAFLAGALLIVLARKRASERS